MMTRLFSHTTPSQSLPAAPRVRRAIQGICLVAALAAVTLLAAGCNDDDPTGPSETTVYGQAMTFGNGTARTFVTVDRANTPTSLGIALSETALTGLPAAGAPVGVVLQLPQQVRPYDHVTVDFMPMGHDPSGVYSVPHFDLHFYMISQAQRATMTPADPQFGAKGARPLAAEFIPAGTAGGPGVVPAMGAHWGPTDAPEFRGQPFQRVFNYCVYDAQLVCMEPMIAKSFLESKPTVSVPIGQAQRVQQPGFYPAAYEIRYEAGAKEYRVTLTGLVNRQ